MMLLGGRRGRGAHGTAVVKPVAEVVYCTCRCQDALVPVDAQAHILKGTRQGKGGIGQCRTVMAREEDVIEVDKGFDEGELSHGIVDQRTRYPLGN